MTGSAKALIVVLGTLAATVSACGSDGGGSSSTTTAAATATAPGGSDAADSADAMRAYFTAINAGDTKAICALADDTLKMFLYNDTADGCANNAANQSAQPAIPAGDQIKIVSKTVGADAAQYVVADQKGATIQVQLERVDGRWFVHVFT